MLDASTIAPQQAPYIFFFAPWTFAAFCILGIATAILALIGASLAIKALTPTQLHLPLRKKYRLVIWFSAIVVVATTLFVGKMNDNGQRDADKIAKQAQQDSHDIKEKLIESETRSARADKRFQMFADSLDKSKFTPDQQSKYIQAQRASAQAADTSTPPPPPPHPVPNQTLTPGPGLAVDAQALIDQLARQDDERVQRINNLLNGLVGADEKKVADNLQSFYSINNTQLRDEYSGAFEKARALMEKAEITPRYLGPSTSELQPMHKQSILPSIRITTLKEARAANVRWFDDLEKEINLVKIHLLRPYTNIPYPDKDSGSAKSQPAA